MSKLNASVGGVCLFITGCCIGWMIGLSANPVIQGVVTSLLTLIAGVVVFIATGLRPSVFFGAEGEESSGSSRPARIGRLSSTVYVMFLSLAIAIGASVGVFARTNEWLGPRPLTFVARWKPTGLSEKELTCRLFDQLYAPAREPSKKGESPDGGTNQQINPLHGTLFAGVAAQEYSEFVAAQEDGPVLRRLMLQSKNEGVRNFANAVGEDDKCLSAAVKFLIRAEP